MTCDAVRYAIDHFNAVEATDGLIIHVFAHLEECPHCEEYMVQQAGKSPPLTPEDKDATTAVFENLQTCQYAVTDTSRIDGASACGEPATHRATWDGGTAWLYLCPEHARRVEEADTGDEP